MIWRRKNVGQNLHHDVAGQQPAFFNIKENDLNKTTQIEIDKRQTVRNFKLRISFKM